MKALILAAGRGTRLGGNDRPKCLTYVGTRTLLDRYLDSLDALQIPVSIVVGHGAAHIAAHVAARAIAPSLVTNTRYAEGSVVSLALGLDELCSDSRSAHGLNDTSSDFSHATHDVLLLDGDVAFTPALLGRLVEDAALNALLVDIGTVFTDEQYMAGVSGGRVMALRRGPVAGFEAQGEWVGFAKLSTSAVHQFRKVVQQQISRGQTSGGYEDALAGLLSELPFDAVPTEGAPWVEIDFADDLKRARELFHDT